MDFLFLDHSVHFHKCLQLLSFGHVVQCNPILTVTSDRNRKRSAWRMRPCMHELESRAVTQHSPFLHLHQALTPLLLSTRHQSLDVLILLLIFFSDPTVLKDTLVLIERQSHTLETHSEFLFSSILSAMDCLTDPRSEEASGK